MANDVQISMAKTRTMQQYKVLDFNEKCEKLTALMDSVLNDDIFRSEFNTLLKKLSISKKDVNKSFLDYNLDVFSHDNSIYQDDAIRVVLHIHNLIRESWHNERQDAVCRFIKKSHAKKIIDLGFGVPSRYVREILFSSLSHLTLCDYNLPALTFAKELLNLWAPDWSHNISFLCEDIEKVSSCVGAYDLYVSLHSIEHVRNPTKCLREYVALSLPSAQFLIEIPIGPITPEHTIAWANIDEARNWIENVGLNIIEEHVTYVNPAIDLFAEPHGFKYGGFLVLCRKK